MLYEGLVVLNDLARGGLRDLVLERDRVPGHLGARELVQPQRIEPHCMISRCGSAERMQTASPLRSLTVPLRSKTAVGHGRE